MRNHFSLRFLILPLFNGQKNSGPAGLCLPPCPELKSPCYTPRGRSAKVCCLWFFNTGAGIYLQIHPSPSVHLEPQNKTYFLLPPRGAGALEARLGTGVDCVSKKHCVAYLPLCVSLRTLTKSLKSSLDLAKETSGSRCILRNEPECSVLRLQNSQHSPVAVTRF